MRRWLAILALAVAGCGTSSDRDESGNKAPASGNNQAASSGNQATDLPEDIVTYPGATVNHAYRAPAGGSLVLVTSDDLSTVLDYYEKEVPARGWEVKVSGRHDKGGAINAFKDKRFQNINVRAHEQGAEIVIRFGQP